MKKNFFTMALIAFFTPVVVVYGTSLVVEDYTTKTHLEQNNPNYDKEWAGFRKDNEALLIANERSITDLRARVIKSGTTDRSFTTKLDEYERHNNDLRTRLNNYKDGQQGWSTFKTAYMADMNDVTQGLKDFTVDNK